MRACPQFTTASPSIHSFLSPCPAGHIALPCLRHACISRRRHIAPLAAIHPFLSRRAERGISSFPRLRGKHIETDACGGYIELRDPTRAQYIERRSRKETHSRSRCGATRYISLRSIRYTLVNSRSRYRAVRDSICSLRERDGISAVLPFSFQTADKSAKYFSSRLTNREENAIIVTVAQDGAPKFGDFPSMQTGRVLL